MATNADEPEDVIDDNKEVTEDDLRDLKYPKGEVETEESADESQEETQDEEVAEDTSEDDGQTDDQTNEGEDEKSEEPSFVKQVPAISGETPEEYLKNLEVAYQQSTAEALRLKRLNDEGKVAPKTDTEESESTETPPLKPLEVYAQQKLDDEIKEAFADFSAKYSQVSEPVEYERFATEVAIVSETIMKSQNRLPSAAEAYRRAANNLDWEPTGSVTDKDRLDNAVKGAASSTKAPTATKPANKSKVTEAMMVANRKMYPEKTDKQIREELEEYL